MRGKTDVDDKGYLTLGTCYTSTHVINYFIQGNTLALVLLIIRSGEGGGIGCE